LSQFEQDIYSIQYSTELQDTEAFILELDSYNTKV